MWKVTSDYGEDSYLVEGFESIPNTRQLRSVGRVVKRRYYRPESLDADGWERSAGNVPYGVETEEVVFSDSEVLEKIPDNEIPKWANRNLEQAKLLSMALQEKF